MKAVVLAGGRGERLSPITDSRPKPLVPVLARPVLDYTLALLAHHGFEKAYLTTHYFSRMLRERYGPRAFGLEIEYLEEAVPLGTCGGVKLLENALSGEAEFLVIAGDAVCDFDLGKTIAFHREKKADVTVVLSGVETPLEYGVVPLDEKGRVTGFAEKPDWSETISEWVNTGIYVLSPRVLEKVPRGQTFDFAKDLFPLLLREGYALYGYKAEGYWCDIGQISSFYRCNRDLLLGKVKTYLPLSGKRYLSPDTVTYVSDGARTSDGAAFYQNNILSPGASVGKGAIVSDSIVMENVTIGEGCVVKGAILCENTRLYPQSSAGLGSVIGAGSVLEKGAAVPEKTHLAPEARVPAKEPFEEEEFSFTEAGVTLGKEGLDEQGVLALGRRAAEVFRGKIGVASRFSDAKAATAAALLESALVQNGAEVFSFGALPREAASFAAMELEMPLFFAVRFGEKASFFGNEADSLPFLRATAAALSRPARGKSEKPGFLWRVPDAEERYVDHLAGKIGSLRTAVGISGDERALFLRRAVLKCGGTAYDDPERARIRVFLDPDGVKIFADETEIDREQAKLLLCLKRMEKGIRRFAVPEKESPLLVRELEKRGGEIARFSMAHTAKNETEIRKRAAEESRFFWDETALCAEILALSGTETIEEVKKQFTALPRWYRKTAHYLPKDENRARLIPAALALESGSVRILPGAYAIRIFAEAFSAEAAEDRAEEIRGKINEIEKNIGR